MKGRIELLMEETGCERGEAELALEMCGYDIEEAVRQIPRLLNDICALKGTFIVPGASRHGLVLIVLNLRTRSLLRGRAVMSYDPAVCAAKLDEDWFAFEKYLYACRLWDGSLPAESLEVEQIISAAVRAADSSAFDRLREPGADAFSADLARALRDHFQDPGLRLKLQKDILDVGQFRSLRKAPPPQSRPDRAAPSPEDLLVVRTALEDDESGISVHELHVGDVVWARIVDTRDIAKYLARLFGGLTSAGPVSIEAPIEAIETVGDQALVRARFAIGVAGDCLVDPRRRVKASRGRSDGSWWRRFFKG